MCLYFLIILYLRNLQYRKVTQCYYMTYYELMKHFIKFLQIAIVFSYLLYNLTTEPGSHDIFYIETYILKTAS